MAVLKHNTVTSLEPKVRSKDSIPISTAVLFKHRGYFLAAGGARWTHVCVGTPLATPTQCTRDSESERVITLSFTLVGALLSPP